MGSGAVGVEFASIFRQFGSEVTLIELLPRLVPNEDEAVSAELRRRSESAASHVRTSTRDVCRQTATVDGVTIEMPRIGRAVRRSLVDSSCSSRSGAGR